MLGHGAGSRSGHSPSLLIARLLILLLLLVLLLIVAAAAAAGLIFRVFALFCRPRLGI